MRVLWTHNFSPDIPNAGSFMHTFRSGLLDLGVQVDLLYLGNLGSPTGLLRVRSQMTEMVKGYDLVHAQFGSACAFATSTAPIPKLVSLRGSDWHRYVGPDRRERNHGILAHLLSRWSLSRYDTIITMSNRMSREVSALGLRAAIQVIPDPIDLSLFRLLDRNTSRQRLFATEDRAPWVLFTTLSATNPVKRSDLAKDAVRLAAERLPGLQMKIANGLRHAEMPEFASTCDVVLCTSTHEGWPNSIKEGLACGLPFVSTDVSDLRDIAGRHHSCVVCRPDARELADGLLQAILSGRSTTLRDEVAFMDSQASSQRLLRVYVDLLNRQGSSDMKRAPGTNQGRN